MTVSVLCLFLIVPSVGMQCVIVVFHYHTHLQIVRAVGVDEPAAGVRKTLQSTKKCSIVIRVNYEYSARCIVALP